MKKLTYKLNRTFFDPWSLVHTTFGIFYGLIVFGFDMHRWYAVILGFALVIGWEIIERITHEGESLMNSFTDIAVASLAATATYYIARSIIDNPTNLFRFIMIIIMLLYAVVVFVYWAYNKYSVPRIPRHKR